MAGGGSRTRIGTEIAGFRIESVLGRGGMSVVYLAEQVRLSRKVALKVLAEQIVELDETFRERFLQESQLVAQLDHPNIIPIYDAGEDREENCLYIAMRYVDGRDLERMLQSDGPLSLGRTLFILEQVASALDLAHANGLVHRDIKPANVLLLEQSDRIYLTDFGVAKPTTSAGLTRTGLFIGTPDYSAPEQIEGRPVDVRTDVYALGGVLYACLTGTAPYAKDTEVAVLQAHLLEPPPRLAEARADLPRALDGVIATAMAKAPQDRYGSAGELISAARAASLDRSVSARDAAADAAPAVGRQPRARAVESMPPAPPATPAPPVQPPPPAAPAEPARPDGRPPFRRTPILVGALGAAVVALAAALIIVLATKHSSSGRGGAAGGGQTRHVFTVALASSAEVPRSMSNSSSGTAKITISGTHVCWNFILKGVDQPNAAHIHRGGPTVSGPVLVPLGPGFNRSGCTTAPAAVVKQILAAPASDYVNVHSVAYPDGAVRGQLARTAGTGASNQVVGLAGVVPSPVFADCKVQARPQLGAAETAVCVPSAGGTRFYPSRLELSIFRSEAAVLTAYDAARKLAHVGTDFGRCDGTSWAGEGNWFHAPETAGHPGKPGGRRFCYFDGDVAVIVWTHEKYGQATHVDFLGIARESGSDHADLFSWWRFWHHRIGKCLQIGCVAEP